MYDGHDVTKGVGLNVDFSADDSSQSSNTPASEGHGHGAFKVIPPEESVFDLRHESKLLFEIAIPAVAVQFSVLFIFPQTASAVGRTLGTDELAGFSLGSLVGNLTCLSVLVGALTAADTLMPRAFGSHDYPEVGRLAIRGLVLCTALLIVPIIPLCTVIDQVFVALGQDPDASLLASQWIRYYVISVPSLVLFRVIQSFLNAQHQVWPLVFSSVFCCFAIHPIVLKYCLAYFDFIGSSLAISITQWCMAVFLVIYLHFRPVYKAETWPGVSTPFVKEALQMRPMLDFFSLSMGGVLSLSEWWFWETVCFIAGSFGVVPLCVHTIAYNLVPLLFMLPLGTIIGVTVRMGHVLAYDVARAKKLAIFCFVFLTILGAIVSSLLYIFRIEIARMFTNDEEVVQGCQDIWLHLCWYIFVLYIFGANTAVLRALGMQWRMAAIIFGCLWLGTLPLIVIFSMTRGGGLDAVWTILPACYTIMQVILVCSFVFEDWNEISRKIRERDSPQNGGVAESSDEVPPSEKTQLII